MQFETRSSLPRDANNLREFSLNRQNSPDVDIKINMAFYSFVDQRISHLANLQLLKMFLDTNKVRIAFGDRDIPLDLISNTQVREMGTI